MISLILKSIIIGTTFAILKSPNWQQNSPGEIIEKSMTTVKRGGIAFAGLLAGSSVLSVGLVLTISNLCETIDRTGNFSISASTWGGMILLLIGSGSFYLAWLKSKNQFFKFDREAEDAEMSEFESTIFQVLQSYLENKRLRRENRQKYRSRKKERLHSVS